MDRPPRSHGSIGTRPGQFFPFPEDVTATMYSVLGIDAAKSLSGPPYGQDFIYMISNRFPDVSER
jgi:hypothetical protein